MRESHPEVAVVCLTASANAREIEALYAAGATACLTKDQELDEIVNAHARGRRRVNLTALNTAIVLDSTADFPDASDRFPNWRVVPLYVNFGTDSYKDGVDLTAHEFYERLRTSPRAADDVAADAGRLPRRLRGARRSYERILSIHIASNLSGTFQSAGTAAQQLGDGRVRTIDSRDRVGRRSRCSRSRSSAGSSAARPTRRSTRSSSATSREHGLLFTVDTLEFLARGGRIGRRRRSPASC